MSSCPYDAMLTSVFHDNFLWKIRHFLNKRHYARSLRAKVSSWSFCGVLVTSRSVSRITLRLAVTTITPECPLVTRLHNTRNFLWHLCIIPACYLRLCWTPNFHLWLFFCTKFQTLNSSIHCGRVTCWSLDVLSNDHAFSIKRHFSH